MIGEDNDAHVIVNYQRGKFLDLSTDVNVQAMIEKPSIMSHPCRRDSPRRCTNRQKSSLSSATSGDALRHGKGRFRGGLFFTNRLIVLGFYLVAGEGFEPPTLGL
jgi:hypothetical protein